MNPRVTLDTNCLIELEQASSLGGAVRALIDMHDAQRIVLSIPAIMASERQRGGTYFANYDEFSQRLLDVGVSRLPQLAPMAYSDISFFDHSIFCDESMTKLERDIHAVLHPGIAYEYVDYCMHHGIDPSHQPSAPKWRNAKCDVQVAWSHIYHRGDLLVTNDENFLKATKLPRLIELGAKSVVRPSESLASLASF